MLETYNRWTPPFPGGPGRPPARSGPSGSPEVLVRQFPLARHLLTIAVVSGPLGFGLLTHSLPWLAGLILGGAGAAAAALGQRLGERGRLVPAFIPVQRPPRDPRANEA